MCNLTYVVQWRLISFTIIINDWNDGTNSEVRKYVHVPNMPTTVKEFEIVLDEHLNTECVNL